MKTFIPLLTLLILGTATSIVSITQDQDMQFLYSALATSLGLAIIFHFNGWLTLDDRQLFKQPLFIIATTYPAYLFLIFGFWAWKDHTLELSADGYAQFLAISKLPLIMLATSVPLGAIVNNVHRTIQTEKQISQSELKNRNDIYYGHVKFIVDQFDKIKGREISHKFQFKIADHIANKKEIEEKIYDIQSQITIIKPIELYGKIFTQASSTSGSTLQVSSQFLDTIQKEWTDIEGICKKIIKKPEPNSDYSLYQKELMEWYRDLNFTHERLCHYLCLDGFQSEYSFIMADKYGHWQLISTFSSGSHLYNSLRSLATVTTLILDRVRDRTMDDYFKPNEPIFKIGAHFASDMTKILTPIIISDYLKPDLHRSLTSTLTTI